MTLQHSNTSSFQRQPLFQPRRKTATGPGEPLPYIPSLEKWNVFLEHLKEMPIAKKSITYLRCKFHSCIWINEFLYDLKLLFFYFNLVPRYCSEKYIKYTQTHKIWNAGF